MNMKRTAFLGLALAAALVPGSFASAAVGSANFSGIVQHISVNNIKVHNPNTNQTLSFLLVPHFSNVFKKDNKTTAQMNTIHNGSYVKVYYDQKALGARHADRILVLDNANDIEAATKS